MFKRWKTALRILFNNQSMASNSKRSSKNKYGLEVLEPVPNNAAVE
jgi:hypothetical protein